VTPDFGEAETNLEFFWARRTGEFAAHIVPGTGSVKQVRAGP